MNIFLGDTCPHEISSVTAIIPARAGSKGLPGKNLMCLGDLPLVEHSIRLALAVKIFNIVVVTTDSPEILELQIKYPTVFFIDRPTCLAQDTSTLIDVIKHVFCSLRLNLGGNPSYLILQPTSPFRLPQNIVNALSFAKKFHVSSLISVVPMIQHPSECIRLEKDDWNLLSNPPTASTRRQDYTNDYFFISGSFYFSTLERLEILNSDCFKRGSSLWNSSEPLTIDIDSAIDFNLAVNMFDYMTKAGYTYSSKEWVV